MQIIPTQGRLLDASYLELCMHALRQGQILCYPTETFYALGIDPWNRDALLKLYALKQRPPEKEMPLIASDLTQVKSICDTSDSRFAILAAKFWPGPLTLILPARVGTGNYAVRISSHPLAAQLAGMFGAPIVSTSANRSGLPALSDPRLLPEAMKSEIAILIDAGPSAGQAPSTIVSLTGHSAEIVREGAIPASAVLSLL